MISDRIKTLREARGISQRELAEEVGVSPGSIGNYESGKRSPDYDTLIDIATFFDASIDYLLGKTNIKKDPAISDEADLLLIKKIDRLTPDQKRNVTELVEALDLKNNQQD